MAWLPVEEYVQTIPQATMFGCLFFTTEDGDPLGLLSVRGVGNWQYPGGNVEHSDATPFDTAVRETREETGLLFEGPQRLLTVQFLQSNPHWPCPKIGLTFDGGVLTRSQLASIVLDPAEHTEWRTMPPAEWEDHMTPASYARLTATCQARHTGQASYLSE